MIPAFVFQCAVKSGYLRNLTTDDLKGFVID